MYKFKENIGERLALESLYNYIINTWYKNKLLSIHRIFIGSILFFLSYFAALLFYCFNPFPLSANKGKNETIK